MQLSDEVYVVLNNCKLSRELDNTEIDNIVTAITLPIGIKQLIEIVEMCICDINNVITIDQIKMCIETRTS